MQIITALLGPPRARHGHGVPSSEPMPSMPMPLPGDPTDPWADPVPSLPSDEEPAAPVKDPDDGGDAPVRLPGEPVQPPVRVH